MGSNTIKLPITHTQTFTARKNKRASMGNMAAFSIKNDTQDGISYSFVTKKGENVSRTVAVGETQLEKGMDYGEHVVVLVKSENTELESIEYKVHAAYDAHETRKWKVVVENEKLEVKKHGM